MHRYRSAFAYSVLVACCVALPSIAPCAGPDVPEPPDKLEFFQGNGWGPLRNQIAAIGKDARGEQVVEGVATGVRLFQDGKSAVNFDAYFPPLHAGDVIPILGRMYEVSRIDSVSVGNVDRARMWAKRLDGAGAPVGVAPGPTSVIVPYGTDRRGYARLDDSYVHFIELMPPKAKGRLDSARLYVLRLPGGKPMAEEATVKAGDVVVLKDKGYKVLSITRPDPKTHVVGWLELDPFGVPEKELTDKKVPVVRPARVELRK